MISHCHEDVDSLEVAVEHSHLLRTIMLLSLNAWGICSEPGRYGMSALTLVKMGGGLSLD